MRALIADDEPLAIERLESLLGELDLAIVATCGDGESAVQLTYETRPDVLFLDIEMPVMDGFAVVDAIDLEPMPLVVFVTAWDHYAVRAFEARALDYICKPAHRERIRDTVERLRSYSAQPDIRGRAGDAARATGRIEPLRRLLIESNGRMRLVPVAQIESIESEGNYVRVHAGTQSCLYRRTLASLEDRLPTGDFFRISRSAIVNLSMVREVGRLSHADLLLTLQSGRQLKLSRTYRGPFEMITT